MSYSVKISAQLIALLSGNKHIAPKPLPLTTHCILALSQLVIIAYSFRCTASTGPLFTHLMLRNSSDNVCIASSITGILFDALHSYGTASLHHLAYLSTICTHMELALWNLPSCRVLTFSDSVLLKFIWLHQFQTRIATYFMFLIHFVLCQNI